MYIFLLFYSIGKWLVPPKPPKPKPFLQKVQEALPHQFSMMYIRNNRQFLFFLIVFIIAVNVILFVTRAYYFRDFAVLNGFTPNPFYMLSRACGKIILMACNVCETGIQLTELDSKIDDNFSLSRSNVTL